MPGTAALPAELYDDTGVIDPARLTPALLKKVFRRLEPIDRMRLVDAIEGNAVTTPTFRQFVKQRRPRFIFGEANERLIRLLQDVADDLLPRLIVIMPPRHGKSELVSRLFPAYFLLRHPEREVGLVTFGAELSHELSRDARQVYLDAGGELAGDSTAVKQWHTAAGGSLWATGAGGTATGRGYHLGIIDDYYKDEEEAWSLKTRRKRNSWYKSVFRTRASPEGHAIVVCMTRWHMDDLIGTLLADEPQARERWHVAHFPVKYRKPRKPSKRPAELDDPDRQAGYQWPATVTVEKDWRRNGEWLFPERVPISEYEALERIELPYQWAALFMGYPIPREGGMFKRVYFKRIDLSALPRSVRWVRRWDLAATKDDGDYTAGLLVGKTRDGRYFVADLVHGQWDPGERDRIIRETAARDRRTFGAVRQIGPQDPAAAGKQAALAFVQNLDGFTASTQIESGDKYTRATIPASQAQAGFYHMVVGHWNETFLTEVTEFGPASDADDIVDALSGAHTYLSATTSVDAGDYKAAKA